MGVWEGIAMAGAVAATTSRIKVGTWVMSALHRNPGISAKAAETLDEISGGRFVFGLGAGHAWPGQAHAFGLPEDQIFARFDEALEVIVPLLRGGHADFEGTYHAARDLQQLPVGPRPGRIPLMIGGNGPKGQRHAARHADLWSSWAEERSDIGEFAPRLASLDAICADLGRDPGTLGRSAGVDVSPLEPAGQHPGAIGGSTEEIADALRTFREAGFTQVEIMTTPGTIAALEALAPVLELLDAN
jgi:alkanesulfonate monooxygenase SsuD/methylene tetrahydromethanopterin reductase-like flavin-dependent oxidoreductase (luciferase family)